ncbi:MAG: DNA polymerase III subunit gamma/tau [Smithellaceae bacterium]
MEYLVLARKFRPQSFEDVAGQEHVVKTLRNSISQGHVAHAFLFSGPRGVGKTTVARILAKSLNCEKGPTPIPCNVCSNCKEITDGSSLDVREIDGASNRGIDEIRELRENVKFAPAAARYKIYIIDEVHMLTREAFNALLKTLEEPPAHVKFIFATTENHKVPATILSRCQCYDFRRISLKEIAENLGKVANAEKIQISSTALSWIAEAGDGSMRDAQSVFDQVISYAGMNINDTDVEDILGLVDRKYLFRLSESIVQREAGNCLIILEEAYLAGMDMKQFYQMMLKHFRNMLLVKIAADGSSSFDIAPEQIEALKKQVKNSTRETLQRYIEILIAEEDNFRRSQEVRLKLETILVRMAYLEPVIPIGEIVSTIEAIEQKLQQGPVDGGNIIAQDSTDNSLPEIPVIKAKSGLENGMTMSVAPPDNLTAEDKGAVNPDQLCDNFKKFIKKENPILGAKIVSAETINFAGGILTLNFPKGYLFLENINEKSQKEQLEQIAKIFFHRDVTIKIATIEIDKNNVNNGNGRSKASNINDIKREAMNHPLLQKVLDEFAGAEIVEIKTKA